MLATAELRLSTVQAAPSTRNVVRFSKSTPITQKIHDGLKCVGLARSFITQLEKAIAYSLSRTVRAEESSISVTTLDVECSSGSQTFKVTDSVKHNLQQLAFKRYIEDEYVERGGIISICKIFPNYPINTAEWEKWQGAELRA